MDPSPPSAPSPLGSGPVPPSPVDFTQPREEQRPTRWWLWVAALLLLGVNVFLQRPVPMDVKKLHALESGALVIPPGMSPEVAVAKAVLAYHGKPVFGVDLSDTLLRSMEPQPEFPGMPATKPDLPQDRFRVALLLAKIGNERETKSRLETLRGEIDPSSKLNADIDAVLGVLDGATVEDAAKDALVERHGWFGKMFLDQGAPGGTIETAKAQGRVFMGTVATALGVLVLLVLLGVVALIGFAVMMMNGSIVAFPTAWRPAPGLGDSRPLWLETVALFLLGFLVLKGIIVLLAIAVKKQVFTGFGEDQLIWVSLIGQWALLPLVLWPWRRGLSWERFKAELGWHSGRGVFREIGTGLVSYLALVPVYLLIAMVVAFAMMAYYSATGQRMMPEDNKIMDLAGGGPLEVAAVFLLATVWAPIVEEAVFRGACFRFVRMRSGLFLAALVSATAFAALHGYMIPQLVLVGTLGFAFALMREWRGSLLPSMTMHCVHNALVFSFTAAIAPIMQG